MTIFADAAFSVLANTTSTNRFAGQNIEFPNRPALLRIRAKASATGLNISVQVMNGITVIDDQPIVKFGAAGGLTFPDDLLTPGAGIPVMPGRINVRYRNTTGGNLTVDMVAELID